MFTNIMLWVTEFQPTLVIVMCLESTTVLCKQIEHYLYFLNTTNQKPCTSSRQNLEDFIISHQWYISNISRYNHGYRVHINAEKILLEASMQYKAIEITIGRLWFSITYNLLIIQKFTVPILTDFQPYFR